MHRRTYLAAAILSALTLALVAAPDVALALTHILAHAGPHLHGAHGLLSHAGLATVGLGALRGLETDLVARAAAKQNEITDGLSQEAIRAIETDHGKLLTELAAVRAQITDAERAAAVDPVAIRAAERERIAGIRSVARTLGLPDELVTPAIDGGQGLDAFRAFAIDEAAKRQADPNHHQNAGASDAGHHRTHAQPKGEKPKGMDATRLMIALAATRGARRDAADYVTQNYGSDAAHVARALGVSTGSAGGFLVPTDMATEVIELLRPESAVMALDPRIVPMPRGNYTIPGLQSGATASYAGESQPIKASQPGFRAVQLSAKKLTALVPMSNDMIRFPTLQTDTIARDDMVLALAERGDLAFIRGQGTEQSPRGLKSFASAPSVAATNTLVAGNLVGSTYASQGQGQTIQALATVTNDLGRMELALLNANVKMRKPGWIMAPRTMMYLMNIRDGLGNQIYYAEMSKGMLRGKPFKTTTQVPTNLTAVDATNAATFDGSEVYLADYAEVFIGEAYGLELEVFPGGTYLDADGNLISGISNDETVMRAIVQHDMNMRQEAAVAVLTGVRWF